MTSVGREIDWTCVAQLGDRAYSQADKGRDQKRIKQKKQNMPHAHHTWQTGVYQFIAPYLPGTSIVSTCSQHYARSIIIIILMTITVNERVHIFE